MVGIAIALVALRGSQNVSLLLRHVASLISTCDYSDDFTSVRRWSGLLFQLCEYAHVYLIGMLVRPHMSVLGSGRSNLKLPNTACYVAMRGSMRCNCGCRKQRCTCSGVCVFRFPYQHDQLKDQIKSTVVPQHVFDRLAGGCG